MHVVHAEQHMAVAVDIAAAASSSITATYCSARAWKLGLAWYKVRQIIEVQVGEDVTTLQILLPGLACIATLWRCHTSQ